MSMFEEKASPDADGDDNHSDMEVRIHFDARPSCVQHNERLSVTDGCPLIAKLRPA